MDSQKRNNRDDKGSLSQGSSVFENMDADFLCYRISVMGVKSQGKLGEGLVQEDVIFPWIQFIGLHTWVCHLQVHWNVHLLVGKMRRKKPSSQLVVRIN